MWWRIVSYNFEEGSRIPHTRGLFVRSLLVHTYRYVHTPHTQTHTHPHPHTHCSAHHGSAMQVLAKTSRSKDGWLACRKAGGRELFVLLDAKLSPASVSEAMDALCDEYFGSVFIH